MSKSDYMEDENMMNVKEVARLIEWLRNKGMTAEEINDCIEFIAEHPTTEKGSGAPGK